MKEWAIEKGATHFTHWFQTADGHHLREATTASSIPSMTLRHHELLRKRADPGRARRLQLPPAACAPSFEGPRHTAWDPTSYAFIKDEVLASHGLLQLHRRGADKKTPLRAHESHRRGRRVLDLFGDDRPIA